MLIVAGLIGFAIGGGVIHFGHRYGAQIRGYVHEKTKPPATGA